MPMVTFDGAEVEQMNHLRHFRIYFDRPLTNRQKGETTALKCRKGLRVLTGTAAKGNEQCHLFLLYQSLTGV